MNSTEALIEATTQAVCRGYTLEGYRLDSNGNLWSFKRAEPKIMVPNNNPAANGYPRYGIRVDGKMLTIKAHRIVAETLIPIPLPTGFRQTIWKQMNAVERNVLMQCLEVNHIDHDTTNFHPSNLEWVTRKENREKAYEFYNGRFN